MRVSLHYLLIADTQQVHKRGQNGAVHLQIPRFFKTFLHFFFVFRDSLWRTIPWFVAAGLQANQTP